MRPAFLLSFDPTTVNYEDWLEAGRQIYTLGGDVTDWAIWSASGDITKAEVTDTMQKAWIGLAESAMRENRSDHTEKPTNPKDAVGIRKWRYLSTVPWTVMCEVGVAMLEGACKYSRHNYRVAGVRASVYFDAAMGHMIQWWEGEDVDADSKLSHVTKAIASLVVLRDAMINDMLTDDRPPSPKLAETRDFLQARVDELFDKYPDPKPAYTIGDKP